LYALQQSATSGIKPTFMRHWLRFLVVLTGGASLACPGPRMARPQATADCSRAPEADAVRTDSIPLERLTGRARLIFIDTVNPQQPVRRAEVALFPPDSTFLENLAEINRQSVRFRPSATPVRPSPLVDARPGQAMWLAGPFGMSEGECLAMICFDTSPTYVSFRYVSGRAVRGTWWNDMTGIVVLVDEKTGRQLPPPAGIVCLIRE
jgi:hypothetical protein